MTDDELMIEALVKKIASLERRFKELETDMYTALNIELAEMVTSLKEYIKKEVKAQVLPN